MKRRWNIPVWAGFLIVLSAVFTYQPVFIRFPATRDFPWATLLISGAGLIVMVHGVKLAYREPRLYRGKVAGTLLMTLAVALLGLFGYGVFYVARQLPLSENAPHAGQMAPDFTLPDKEGNPFTLSRLLDSGASGADRVNGALLIFYRGYW